MGFRPAGPAYPSLPLSGHPLPGWTTPVPEHTGTDTRHVFPLLYPAASPKSPPRGHPPGSLLVAPCTSPSSCHIPQTLSTNHPSFWDQEPPEGRARPCAGCTLSRRRLGAAGGGNEGTGGSGGATVQWQGRKASWGWGDGGGFLQRAGLSVASGAREGGQVWSGRRLPRARDVWPAGLPP